MITNQTERLNFASTKNIPQYPDFLDVQVKSFKDFFQLETKSDERGNEGLYNTFMENFPYLIDLSIEQAHLASNLSAWMLVESRHEIQEFLNS